MFFFFKKILFKKQFNLTASSLVMKHSFYQHLSYQIASTLAWLVLKDNPSSFKFNFFLVELWQKLFSNKEYLFLFTLFSPLPPPFDYYWFLILNGIVIKKINY
jgi:hypothetical protein